MSDRLKTIGQDKHGKKRQGNDLVRQHECQEMRRVERGNNNTGKAGRVGPAYADKDTAQILLSLSTVDECKTFHTTCECGKCGLFQLH